MQRKTIVWLAALSCASTLTLQGQAVQITERGAHHRVIESVGQQFDATGELVTVTNQFTELANGLHYWDEGQWKETEEVIELLNGGAAARKGPHKVIFSPNINTAGAVDLETPEGQRFQSQVFGLSYLDTSTGQSVLIAELKDSFGELIADNQVLYPDAFTDFEADVRFTYTKAGFEQDIILRQNPPSPSEYGLNPETTQLQVLTEFFDPPQPQGRVDAEGKAKAPEREFVGNNLPDEKLEFGSMHIGKGKAFALDGVESSNLPAERTGGHPVGKQWDQLEGRNFLIESVEYPRLAPELEQLQSAPPVEEARLKSPNRKLVQIIQQRTPSVEAKVNGSIKKLAQVTHRPGVVVDYVIVNTVANHTFQSDTTYYVGGAVTLSGLTVIEGGTVVKYTNDAQVKIQGWVECRTGPYRPAIFTAKDDSTVGDSLPGSTGSPYGNYYANAALYLDDKASELHHLRIMYAKEAIYYDNDSGDPSRLRHVQLVHCLRGIQPRATPLLVQNVLMHNVQTNFYNTTYSVEVRGEHLTINTADKLNAATGTIDLFLTNSLLVAVANTNGYDGAYNHTYSSASGVLQTAGAGANYLVDGSELRNAGTEHITPRLKSDLAKLTTMPPIVWTNHITTPTVFAPEAQRDSDTPDIGYHYYPLDYVSGGINVSNVLVLTNGVVLGTYGATTLNVLQGGQLVSQGTIERLNWITRYNMAQEQYTNSWSGAVGTVVGVGTASTPQPKITAQHTGWSLPGINGYHLYGSVQVTNVMTFRDCQFYGAKFFARGFPVDYFNNLFERVGVTLQTAGYSIAFNQYNNLFYGGSLALSVTSSSINKDNQYFFTAISPTTGPTHDYNAYYTGEDQLTPSGANDVVLTNWGFLQGPLGRYYHRSTTLSGTGSRTAANAGLYHHTVRMSQAKEGSGTVDIGFHYPSVALTNLALSKIATQSSDYSGSHTATNGVNGNQLGTLAHTQTENNAWWQVDLGTTNFIDSVWIWNRNDTFSNRLSNFNLYVSGSNFASNDPATTKGTAGVLTYFNGPPSPHPGYYDVRHPGRYVRIQQTANAPMNIYELEVYTSLYPVDTDGDGVADYLEDRNGNGTHDGGSGETNWNSYDSANGLSGAGALQTFTPLK